MVAVFCVFSTILNRDSQLVSSSLSSKWKQIIMTNSLVKTGTVNSQGAFLYIMIGPLPVDSLQFFDLINWILDTDWIKKKLKPAGFETPRLLLLFFGYPLFSFLNPKGYIFCATAIFQSVVWSTWKLYPLATCGEEFWLTPPCHLIQHSHQLKDIAMTCLVFPCEKAWT